MVTIDKTEQEKSELIARYIERNPNKPAVYDARLNPYGVSIWAIAATLKQSMAVILIARQRSMAFRARQSRPHWRFTSDTRLRLMRKLKACARYPRDGTTKIRGAIAWKRLGTDMSLK